MRRSEGRVSGVEGEDELTDDIRDFDKFY